MPEQTPLPHGIAPASPVIFAVGATHSYEPFQGICLTDTFQLYEKGDMISDLLTNNSDRRKRQKALDIRVIIGNPPYSKGQDSANDNNQNVAYPELDERILQTYVKNSNAALSKELYNSYVRAIRWASDRVGSSGIVGFVTNAGFLEANTTNGLRKCLAEEFSRIYVFHLRGNQRTSGELSRKEGGKIFGSGSRSPIAITLLVKNPQSNQHGQIFWHDIGDYLSQAEKLSIVAKFGSIAGISLANAWQSISPDEHHDWTKQRDDGFGHFIALGDKKGDGAKLFENFSLGVATNRDSWCYNAGRSSVAANMERMIGFYNHETGRFGEAHGALEKKARDSKVDGFIETDPSRIKWTRGLKQELSKGRTFRFEPECLTVSLYRPFTKQWLYFNRRFNEMVLQMPRIFPTAAAENLVIILPGPGEDRPFSVLMSRALPDLHTLHGGQCFPLFLFDEADEATDDDLFSSATSANPTTHTRRDAITDAGLAHFQAAYPGETLTKEDLFYYIYGLLHSPDYRSRYADNLGKELPRIPAVKTFADFRAFSQAGRDLAHWHLNYETVDCYPGVKVDEVASTTLDYFTDGPYRVTKMKFARTKDPATGKTVPDKTTVIYNEYITLRDIPLAAYDYIVNGKPALEWVMERQAVTTDKDSGITNDANLWATETMGNARYSLELFQRVITVSLETMKIVNGLPGLDIV